jgi:KDO2-lipid IV(A) lauroyltransferase
MLVFVDKIFLLIPFWFAIYIGRFLGFLSYICLPRYRRLTKQQVSYAFDGEKTESQIDEITRKVFRNICIMMVEGFSLPKLKKRLDDIIEVKNIERVDEVLKQGNGSVVISAHLGNWELIAMYFAQKGYPSNVIARPIYYKKYDEWVSAIRNSMDVNVIYRTESPKKVLRVLKNNELLGILADQDIDSVEGVFVDFFGKKAYTPSAPVKLAIASGAPILPMFIIRQGAGCKHTIFVEEPIIIDGHADKQKAVIENTQKWSDVVESYVRKYPEQWVWMHKRWKTRPPQEDD